LTTPEGTPSRHKTRHIPFSARSHYPGGERNVPPPDQIGGGTEVGTDGTHRSAVHRHLQMSIHKVAANHHGCPLERRRQTIHRVFTAIRMQSDKTTPAVLTKGLMTQRCRSTGHAGDPYKQAAMPVKQEVAA